MRRPELIRTTDMPAEAGLRRMLRALTLLVLCTPLTSCATLGRLYGIERDYRNDELAVLDVHVIGPAACVSCTSMGSKLTRPVQGATVTIRGPRGASAPDTLSMITDVHGQALFEGVVAGSYVVEVEPPSGYPRAVPRITNLPANAKRSLKYHLDGLIGNNRNVVGVKR